MKKQINSIVKTIAISSIFLFAISTNVLAQTGPTFNGSVNDDVTAQQTVQLALSNALEITFTSNGSATGGTVTLPFTSVNDYANGVESGVQEIKIRSNKNFGVNVKTSTANFSVTTNGVTSPSSMPTSVLGVEVTANATGGSIASGFSFSTYSSLSSTAANLIENATYGGNQTFSVKYKATPGFAYSEGTYAADVVYTATQQ